LGFAFLFDHTFFNFPEKQNQVACLFFPVLVGLFNYSSGGLELPAPTT
jgi:hypothetical protein